MKIIYDKKSKMLNIQLSETSTVESENINGVVLDYDENNRVVNIEIENFDENYDMTNLSFQTLNENFKIG
jgi:uncharacterized protein YuzE